MKKILTLICTLLCANVLLAQDYFIAGQLAYRFTSNSSVEVYSYTIDNTPTDLVIPSTVTYQGTSYSVTSIGKRALRNCSSLTSVTIPNSVTSIGDAAFSGCSSLTSITIPNSVTSIGSLAFYGCCSLTSIEIPNSVTSIGSLAFYGCCSLTSIEIPNSVTSIGGAAFLDCISLTSVTLSNNITELPYYSEFGENYGFFSGCSSLTSITIPNSVTSIGDFAFDNCSSLASVNIPNSVTSIGGLAFYFCSSLTSIEIPNSVTSIGGYAFYNCSSLTSVTIPNSVTSIGGYAFYNCSSLTSVTLPENATIGNNAFSNVGTRVIIDSITYSGPYASLMVGFNTFNVGFTTFYVGDNVYHHVVDASVIDCDTSKSGEVVISSIEINDMEYPVTSIGEYAFENCNSLTSVTIPNSVTFIGDDVFENCSSLTSMTIDMNNIPNLSNIGLNSTLQNLTLGENVTSIASGAFNNYSFLQNVTCLATTPPTLADNTVFPYPNIATLTVPCGTLEAYSSPTSFWNMFFAGRIEEDCSGLEDAEFAELSVYPNPTRGKVSFNQAIEKIEVIDLSGKTLQTYENANEINIESLPAGVYHLRMTIEDKTTTRKIIKE